MKQILLKSWLTMLCLLVGVGTSWAEDLVVTYDFTSADNYPAGFPTSSGTSVTTETEYTFGENTIYFKTANSGNLYQAKYSEEYSVFLGKNVKYSATDANSIASTAYMKIPGKTGYKITKLVVTNAANAATKDINLAVCNSSYQMVISSGVASSTSNAMTFNINSTGTTLAENEAAYFCVAPTVASGKNLNVRKIVVTYTPCEASVKYNVNIANDVLNGTVESNVTSASEGATVTLTAKPSNGYKLDSWNVTNASTSAAITVTNNQFTMPAADVNVSASFSEIQKHTITWSVNGNTSTIAPTQVEDGENITFPTGLVDIYGKKFVGWSANKDASAATDLVSGDVAASADVTYYAVFANVTLGGTETATLTISDKETVTYTNGLERTDDKGNVWKSYACIANQTSNKVTYFMIQINKNSNGYYIGSPDFGNNVKSIKGKVWNTNSSARYVYLKSNTNTKQPSTSDFGTTEIAGSSKGVEIDFAINKDAQFSQFYIYSSGAIGFESIAVTYGSEDVISDYTTTPQASEPSYSEAKALNVTADNGKERYFTTFSSDKVTFFPEYDEDMTFATAIKTAMVDDTEFILEKIAKGTATIGGEDVEGFFVPANTGVLVQVEYDDKVEKNVPYYEVENKTVNALDGNDLHAGNGEMLPAGKVWYKLAWADASHAPSTLGFYYGAAGGAPFTSTKGKAYLGLTQEQAAMKISFSLVDDEATSIKTVDTVNGTSAVYNLAGQRVAPNAKGIVIVNGKKFINK